MINPWLETVGVGVVILLGIFLGRLFSKMRKPWWTAGYFVSLVLISILVITKWLLPLAFVRPLSWLVMGRGQFVILALAVTMGLTTPLSRLTRRLERVMICILMALVVAWFSILPFLVPALTKDRMLRLGTVIDSDGVCLQTTRYTCGPAAAVTALKMLHLPAQQGQIAALAHTTPILGTLPATLCRALNHYYGRDGLECRYQYFDSIAQLKNAGLTLAVIKEAFLRYHCVAVLEVSGDKVVFADPTLGKMTVSHQQFEKMWRFTGITLTKKPAERI